jgi:hypothetical protein
MTNDESFAGDEALHLLSGQTEFLQVEPILVTLRLQSDRTESLPAGPGKTPGGALRFVIDPSVQPRSGAQPLPLERQASATGAQARDYDLLEWYQFPEEGKFTVQAVLEYQGGTLTSRQITITIRKPGQDDPELPPVARIHHPPWCNYGENKFCGDTFDLAQRWPDSRLAKYCHYWNGRFLQHNKQYDKAIASYQTVVENYPDFALADDADFGIVQCLAALGQSEQAQKHNAEVLRKYDARARESAAKFGPGQSVVQRLAHGMTEEVNR